MSFLVRNCGGLGNLAAEKELREYSRAKDPSVMFKHIRRQGNSIAHNIARHARYVSGFAVWMEELLSHL